MAPERANLGKAETVLRANTGDIDPRWLREDTEVKGQPCSECPQGPGMSIMRKAVNPILGLGKG